MALNGRQWTDPNTKQYIDELERVLADMRAQIQAQAELIRNLRNRR